MKAFAFAMLAGLAAGSFGSSAQAIDLPADAPLVQADWQEPQSLPRRFRNHCTFDSFSGRPYCSDHCGIDYQLYFCSEISYGCCHVGHGYCDFNGMVRCYP